MVENDKKRIWRIGILIIFIVIVIIIISIFRSNVVNVDGKSHSIVENINLNWVSLQENGLCILFHPFTSQNCFERVIQTKAIMETANSLETKALNVGRQSQERIITDIEVVQISVQDIPDEKINISIDNIAVVVRLSSGSNPIKLADLLLKFDSNMGSQTLVVGPTSSITNYDVEYVKNGINPQDGYLVEGDLVKFVFIVGTNIAEIESATLRLIAKNGAVKSIDIIVPSPKVAGTTLLYP